MRVLRVGVGMSCSPFTSPRLAMNRMTGVDQHQPKALARGCRFGCHGCTRSSTLLRWCRTFVARGCATLRLRTDAISCRPLCSSWPGDAAGAERRRSEPSAECPSGVKRPAGVCRRLLIHAGSFRQSSIQCCRRVALIVGGRETSGMEPGGCCAQLQVDRLTPPQHESERHAAGDMLHGNRARTALTTAR